MQKATNNDIIIVKHTRMSQKHDFKITTTITTSKTNVKMTNFYFKVSTILKLPAYSDILQK